MNERDIEEAYARYKDHEVIGLAVTILYFYMEEVNRNSDGWVYWRTGAKAAKPIEDMVQNFVRAAQGYGAYHGMKFTFDEVAFKRAVSSLKRFCTLHKLTFPVLEDVKASTATKLIGQAHAGLDAFEKGSAAYVLAGDATLIYYKDGSCLAYRVDGPAGRDGGGGWMVSTCVEGCPCVAPRVIGAQRITPSAGQPTRAGAK